MYMSQLHDVTQFYHKIFYHDCAEFEEIRELCLQEDNWLRHIYTKDNLSVSRHNGFVVIFDSRTDEPAAFGGVYRDERLLPKNLARMINRTYWFPNYRTHSFKGFTKLWKVAVEHGIKPLERINNFDGYYMAIQDRKKPTTGYFDVWVRGLQLADPRWIKGEGLLQTCPYNVKNCWQHYVYLNSFNNWNPNIITNKQWEDLPEGIET